MPQPVTASSTLRIGGGLSASDRSNIPQKHSLPASSAPPSTPSSLTATTAAFTTRSARPPLPRVSDAVPVAQEASNIRPAASAPSVIDTRTGSESRQRLLLHSVFPSLSRISRLNREAQDSSSVASSSPIDPNPSPPTIPNPSPTTDVDTTTPPNHPSSLRTDSVSSSSISSHYKSSVSDQTTYTVSDIDSVDDDKTSKSLTSFDTSTAKFSTEETSSSQPHNSSPNCAAESNKSCRSLRKESEHSLSKGASGSEGASLDQLSTNRSKRSTSKMHQTSSRLLRMTDDDRPFTRDFKDLFSTLMVSLPLTPHRVRFSKIEHTFTTDEAITNLGSLKFSQSNRMPDPKDPSRIVTTTTTTTFSMAKEMARSVCNKFLEARFIETCEGKTDFNSKSSVWQLTPKGMRVLTRFCSRNGIHQRHVNELLDSPRNMMQLVILERDDRTDKLNHDRAMIEVIFRRFAGDTPNVKTSSAASDNESLNEYATGLVGCRVIKSRKPTDQLTPYILNGKSAIDWLMDCCMVVDRRECYELANLFLAHELVAPIMEERNPTERHHPHQSRFQPVKTAHYFITEKGMKLASWMKSPTASVSGGIDMIQVKLPPGVARDSNTNRMTIIIRDPALRLLFREFLQETHCEENLTFYLEVKLFLIDYGVAKRSTPARLDLIRETLASAYSLYNAFLAPGSPCELNIDHNLRNALAGRMTRAVGEDTEMLSSLDEVAVLFDQAQTSVFKLMASDSVPKFSKDPKYATVLRDRNLEQLLLAAPA